MKKLVTACALSMAVSACGNAFPDYSSVELDGSIEDRARFIATTMGPLFPIEDANVTFVAIRAEKDELVIDVEMPIERGYNPRPSELTRELRPIVCGEGYRSFIEKGGVMRFDIRDPQSGRGLPPARVANCSGIARR